MSAPTVRNSSEMRLGPEIPIAIRLLLGAISGVALSFSFMGYYLQIFSWFCVAILLVALLETRAWVAFGAGFLHGLLFVLTSLSWIGEVLAVHGGLSKNGGNAVLLLIAAAWGVLTGSFAWCVNRIARRNFRWACIGVPCFWVVFEFARDHLPEISFPWNLLGYPASGNLAFLQITNVTGIFGLSWIVAGFNALLIWTTYAKDVGLRRRIGILGGSVLAILVVGIVGPRLVPQVPAHHFARAVQLNFPETTGFVNDWFVAHKADLEEVSRLSLAPSTNQPDLLVWPEAPAPFSYQDPQFAVRAVSLTAQFQHPFLVGVIEWKQPPGTPDNVHSRFAPYNSALLFNAQGLRTFSYDKIHLVPFGEYEPFPLIHRVVQSVSDEVGGFHKGSSYNVGQFANGYKFGVFICYEAIYASEVRQFAANGAQLLINISNDGWFGTSAAAEQHLRMVRVRAVENRRWIVRSTNSGITASIDPYGRITRPLGRDMRAAADLAYDFRTDTTIYTRWSDWVAWLSLVISVILLLSTFRKAK